MIEEIKKIPSHKLPSHIAIIMDGNRRWAKKRGYPLFYGHKKGVETVKKIVKACRKIGINYLTLYTFSTENWKRTKREVFLLMKLLKEAIKSYSEDLLKNDISLKISGRIYEFPEDLRKELENSLSKLSGCKSMVLNIALNYGGRQEIVDAINRCILDGIKKVNEEEIAKRLYTYPLPDPDLIIRTSGEMRISNFLLWQSAYSEFFISEKYWPDFEERDLYRAIIEYSKRERRMGR